MDFLGIGPLEIFFVILLVLIIFGPNELVKTGKTIGSFLRKVVKSDGWRAFQQAQRGMRNLPTTLMREAGLEEEDLRQLTGYKDLEKSTREFQNQISPWTTPPAKKPELLTDPYEIAAETNSPAPEPVSSQPTNPAKTPQEPHSPPSRSPFSQSLEE